jgi:hypothetical protein
VYLCPGGSRTPQHPHVPERKGQKRSPEKENKGALSNGKIEHPHPQNAVEENPQIFMGRYEAFVEICYDDCSE